MTAARACRYADLLSVRARTFSLASRARGAAARRESVGVGAGPGAHAVAQGAVGGVSARARRGAADGDAVARSSSAGPKATRAPPARRCRTTAAACRWSCRSCSPRRWRFVAGVVIGRRRRRSARPRRRAVRSSSRRRAPEPKRFDWRTYPPPARPAPPLRGAARPTAVAVRSPWTRQAWRAEIVWDEGFKVMVLEPGLAPRRPNGGGPARAALAEQLQDLQAALEAEGWTPAGRAEPWYGRRFVWQHPDPPPGQGGPR